MPPLLQNQESLGTGLLNSTRSRGDHRDGVTATAGDKHIADRPARLIHRFNKKDARSCHRLSKAPWRDLGNVLAGIETLAQIGHLPIGPRGSHEGNYRNQHDPGDCQPRDRTDPCTQATASREPDHHLRIPPRPTDRQQHRNIERQDH